MRRMDRSAAVGGMLGAGLVVAVLLAGCGSGGASGSPGVPTAVTGPTGSLSEAGNPFAGLTYRLDLPADWIVPGDRQYDDTLDAAPAMADWLATLDLVGPNAFRAYEPVGRAGGLRVAMNQSSSFMTDAGPLQDGDLLARLPGVSAPPVGELVPVGTMNKAGRFSWTQELDWGDGQVTARECVSYVVVGEFAPVGIVFTYPADTDRMAEVEALVATLVVTGNPAESEPSGAVPTPYDKNASMAPAATPHEAPELEALLPDLVGDIHFWKMSTVGVGDEADDPVFGPFGKTPADYASATAESDTPPLFLIGVQHLAGVPGTELLAAMLANIPADEIEATSLGGRAVTAVVHGAWPVWYWTAGELVYGVAAPDERQVVAAMAAMP